MSTEQLFGIEDLITEEEREIRRAVREYCDREARPHIAEWFERGTVPARELALGLGKLGVLGMQLRGYGCAGLGAVAYGLACLELEAADSGLRSLVSVQGSLAMHAIHAYGSEEQRQRWLPGMAAGERIGCFALTEPDFGSDPGSMRTRAVRSGGDWVLDGTKMWITNGSVADVAVVWARTEDGIGGFLVPAGTPGCTAREITRKLSLRASVTSELAFDGVRVPAAARLPGARGLAAPLSCLTEARFGIVFGALGAALECLRAATGFAAAREVFARPLASYQLTQERLAEMALGVGTGLLLALHLGRRKEAGTLTAEQVSAGKLNNTRQALAVARACRALLGASGITLDYPVMRHSANLETVLTYEGTAEIHTLVLGRALTGIPAFR